MTGERSIPKRSAASLWLSSPVASETLRGVPLDAMPLVFTHANVDFPGCDTIVGGDCTRYGIPVVENEVIDFTLNLGVDVDATAFALTYGITDRIDFGAKDSYQLTFALDGVELKRLFEQVGAAEKTPPPGVGGNLAKLRAILDLARTLQSSFSIDEVLISVVDTALAITGAERGFLLLRTQNGLETKVARNAKGQHLRETDLRVRLQRFDGVVGTDVGLEQMQIRPIGPVALEREARRPYAAEIPKTDE